MGENERFIRDQLNKMIMKRYSQPMTPEERLKGGASALPVIGDAISAYDAYQSAKQGDYIGAALNGIGALPFIPALAGITKKIEIPENIKKLTDKYEMQKFLLGNKVVDINNAPITVYHGTGTAFNPMIKNPPTGVFDKFNPKYTGLATKTDKGAGSAFFFSDSPRVASGYSYIDVLPNGQPKLKNMANVRPHYVSIKKPLELDAEGAAWNGLWFNGKNTDINQLIKYAKKNGNDGIIVKNVLDNHISKLINEPSTTYVAFNNKQIKSAILDRINAPVLPWKNDWRKPLSDVKKQWDSANIDHYMSEKNGVISLDRMIVDYIKRGKGDGTKAMNQLIQHADDTGKIIAVTPTNVFGGNKERVENFFKKLGFVENNNKSINKQFIKIPKQ